ncbi:acyltransferase family protein [Kocuria atrinae]|uniref:acyltransferase family protein n=1 Tax=Kocuria atrinae TaxID=592377 RepID=UPI0002EFC472
MVGPTPARSFPKFRPEIEGLRAIAVLLVMVFHIWEGRVSGGVDVFFVISAFLLTGSFTRAFESGKPIRLAAYWLRTFSRLLPPLAVMLVVMAAAIMLLYPASRQDLLIGHLWASASYVLNWVLSEQAVDYYQALGCCPRRFNMCGHCRSRGRSSFCGLSSCWRAPVLPRLPG